MAKSSALQSANANVVAAALAPYIDPTLPTRDRYRLDPWAHVDDGHVVIQDLESKTPQIWVPYQHQKDLVEAWVDLDYLAETALQGMPIVRLRNVLEEKSRQMGMTWALAWAILWLIMYHPVSLLCVHEHLAELDDGGQAATVKSLFGRILFMARGKLTPETCVWPDDLRPLRHLNARQRPSVISNPLRGGFVTAEGQGPDPARGSTFHGVLLEEAARIPWSEQVEASVASVCPDGRLYNSTPHGTGNTYGRLVKTRPANFRFLRHHWSVHPLYGRGLHVAGADPGTCEMCAGNERGDTWDASDPTCHRYPGKLTSPWYDRAVLGMTDQTVSQELEIDYTGALTGRVYPEFSDEIHVVDEIPYNPRLPIMTAWDYGVGTTAVAILQETATEILQIGELEVHDAIPDNVVPALLDVLADLGVPLIELEPQFTRDWLGVGDPAGDARTPTTGEPLTTAYSKLGFTIQSRKRSIDETIRATKRVLQGRPKEYRISAATCPLTIEHWRENRWPTNREGVVSPNATEPKNDQHNHIMRALAYLLTWLFPAPSVDAALEHATSGFEPSALDELNEDARGDARAYPGFEIDDRGHGDDGGLRPDMGL